MSGNPSSQELRWDPPGPGPWEAEGAHFPKPLPTFARQTFVKSFMKGFADGTRRYGLLLSHFEVGIVNGFWFQQPAAFGAPKGAKGPPPGPILWLLTRLHPALRARIRTSRDAFANRIWRDDLRRWDETDKPKALARHRELLAIEPSSLSDEALVAHLAVCEEHLGEMIVLHHIYTISSSIPTGDLIAHAAEWTGSSVGEVLQLLRGSTPLSLGFSAGELEALAEALRLDPNGAALLDEKRSASELVAGLRQASGRVGEAARAFFDLVWHRAVSYDIGDKASGEMPETLLAGVRSAVAGKNKARGDGIELQASKAKALRDRVPEQHRAQFDELLGEVRTINRLRDERGLYADCWAVGIARRALLEAGRRLVAKGKLGEAGHAVDLDLSEMRALFAVASSGPTADEVKQRAEWRRTKSVADIPHFLGGQPAGPPPMSLLPAAAQRSARAVDAVIFNIFKECEASSSEATIRGISVNEGQYEGTARLINDASEFDRIKQGDVLVTRATSPYFNVVLPLLGGIVTDRGGQLCHAAIVAREYGIPGVVGTKDGTRLIPDGARVLIDGSKGEVRILSRP